MEGDESNGTATVTEAADQTDGGDSPVDAAEETTAAAARTPLNWTDEGENDPAGGEHWFSAASSVVPAEDDLAFRFRVCPSSDGSGKWLVADSADELLGDGIAPEFESSDAAKQWCEERDASLLASMKAEPVIAETGETPAPQADAAATPSPAEPKVGSAGADAITGTIHPSHWHAIQEAREAIVDAETDIKGLLSEIKEAKGRRDKAQANLDRLIDEGTSPTVFTKVNPVDRVAISAGSTAADPVRNEMPTPTADAASADDDAWRSVLIADLTPALKAGKLKALAEHTPPITTMGEMADWQTSKGDWWVKDISGFGPGGAEQYAAAADAYWAAHPQAKPAAVEKAEPAAVLAWLDDEVQGVIYATNTAGIEVEGDVHADFVIEPDGPKFDVTASDAQLLPDENPGEFDTLDAAKAWCERRNGELLAAKPADDAKSDAAVDFDDDEIEGSESIVSLPGQLVIAVGQRRGGRWAECHFAAVTPAKQISTNLEGHHSSRAAAITAAADAVGDWLKTLDVGGKAAKRATEIKKALDGLDKSIAGEAGSASDGNAKAVSEELQTA